MTCYQSTSLPGGVTTTGRTSYKTEAECLQACKEGACCEGTTCSVKPQCQCVDASAGACCGPDWFVNGLGQTRLVCRTEQKSACDQRGGVWRWNAGCGADEKIGPLGCGVSPPQPLPNPNPPVFKGVGTVCSPNPCNPLP